MSNTPSKYDEYSRLPGLLAWYLELGPVVTDADICTEVKAIDDSTDAENLELEPNELGLQLGLVQLGGAAAFQGAPIFLPRLPTREDSNKTFDMAYAPMAILTLAAEAGDQFRIALNSQHCRWLARQLDQKAKELTKWEDAETQVGEMSKACEDLLTLTGLHRGEV